jgi:hypothetical protein
VLPVKVRKDCPLPNGKNHWKKLPTIPYNIL